MAKRKALFLVRDGVINIDTAYGARPRGVYFSEKESSTFAAPRRRSGRYLLFVVTNQAGIARGYYTESDFLELTDWMIAEFGRRRFTDYEKGILLPVSSRSRSGGV